MAALVRRYTNSGSFDGTTNPTLTVVEGWIDQVSAFINVRLAEHGFSIPVSQATCVLTLAATVNTAVSDLAQAANNAGRFFTDRALERGVSPMAIIQKELAAWVDDNAEGFEALGAARSTAAVGAAIGYKSTDINGNTPEPLFTRQDFGETYGGRGR